MKVDNRVIKRFLEDNEREGDREMILEWFSDLTAEKELRKHYRKYWNEKLNDIHTIEGFDGSAILDRIYHKLKLEESRPPNSIRTIKHTIKMLSRIAAILFIPLLLAFLFINREQISLKKSNIAWSEIYAPTGARSHFFLPDGSSGWLNSNSHLEFPAEFSGKTRKVRLVGEAYFEVTCNPDKPFVVTGNSIEVVAHGTKFNVMAYPGEDEIEVTLVEGTVDVTGLNDREEEFVSRLIPNQTCIYNVNARSSRIKNVAAERIVCWKDGKLVFRNEPFDEVVNRLNRWYNVNLVIKDDLLKSYIYMATFQDETLDEMLKLLQLSAPIDYKDLGREILTDGTFSKREIEIYYKSRK